MTPGLAFDDRLWNPYAVENLAQSHPDLHAHLDAWFGAVRDFDDTSLLKLVNAKGPDEVAKWREKGLAALDGARGVARSLESVLTTLEAKLAGPHAFPERAQLEALLDSARRNRVALREQAPALVAEALASVANAADAKTAAATAVQDTARKLEKMRERASDTSLAYRSLQPMTAELRETWAALDAALAPLSREDQRAVRQPHQARMSAEAGALCLLLFDAKMRDRKSGAWPMPDIAPPGDSVAERFGAAMAGRAFDAAAATLAPWLRDTWTPARLAAELNRAATQTAAGFDLEEAPAPGGWSVAQNPMRYQDVRDEEDADAPVPHEVTSENFIAWHGVEIQTEEEDEYLTDIGCLMKFFAVTVRTPDGERVGYLSVAE